MLGKYELFDKLLNFDSKDYFMLNTNMEDSIAFNNYLQEDEKYFNNELDSLKSVRELLVFFKENNISLTEAKKIIVSCPIVFYCDDFRKQIQFIYKDEEIEGLIIIDKKNVKHAYRLTNNKRSISESESLLKEVINDTDETYKKSYYTKKR